jgi:hypothetical protein
MEYTLIAAEALNVYSMYSFFEVILKVESKVDQLKAIAGCFVHVGIEKVVMSKKNAQNEAMSKRALDLYKILVKDSESFVSMATGRNL